MLKYNMSLTFYQDHNFEDYFNNFEGYLLWNVDPASLIIQAIT
jgi:hypothetical protein